MYNLLIAGNAGTWDEGRLELEVERAVREYTDSALTAKFGSFDEEARKALLSFPSLFAYERGVNADARLGRLKAIRPHGRDVRLEYELYTDLPPIPAEALSRLTWELDIGKLELNRTHWAVKSVDLLAVLRDAELITNKDAERLSNAALRRARWEGATPLYVRPTVFNVPTSGQQPDLVAVMMPFDSGFRAVYASIRNACSDANLRCQRADDVWQESIIIQDVFELLYTSSIVVVDFSGRNPNVMYETGIAHTLGRTVVPIAQSLDDVPFDLRHHRVLKYLPNSEGLTAMRHVLADRLRTLS